MNWEVSSMPFRTSFCNATLFKNTLRHSSHLWGCMTAIGALVPLYMILALMSGQELYMNRVEFVHTLYCAVAYALPVISFLYAGLVARVVWSYLHKSNSVDMIHSLAVSRTTLFITHTLSGLVVLLIPYVLVGASLCVFAVCYGAMDVGAVALTVLAVLLESLLFFGIATFCAMITGSVRAMATYYLVLNFLAPVVDLLCKSLAQEFILGLTGDASEFSFYFAPALGLPRYVGVETQFSEGYAQMLSATLEGFWLIAVYGLVGVLLLVASWALYRARHSECAGNVVAFRALRPVFRFGISVLFALSLGRMAYGVFWAGLFGRDGEGDIVPMLMCMVFVGVLGYYFASRRLTRSRQVYKGSLKGVVQVSVAIVALVMVIALDLFGVEGYVPDAEDVQTVDVWGDVNFDYQAEAHDIALCERITDLHRAIIEHEEYLRSDETWDGGDMAWTSFYVSYVLKNGSSVDRYYSLPVSVSRISESGSYESLMKSIAEDPVALKASVMLPEGAELISGDLECYNLAAGEDEYLGIRSEDCKKIHAALLRDAEEGNFFLGNNYLFHMNDQEILRITGWERFEGQYSLYLRYRYDESYASNDFYDSIVYVTLQPGMKHTLQALVDCGVVTQEIIDGWTIR